MRLLPMGFLFASLALAGAAPLAAQNAPRPVPPAASSDTGTALWRREQPNRLLLVVPPAKQELSAKPPPQSFAQWLREHDQVVHTFGAVTTVAKRVQSVPVSDLAPPDLLATGNPWINKMNARPLLLESLSDAQWQEIASPQGLSVGNLSESQHKLWELVVPNPFVFDRTTTTAAQRTSAQEDTRTLTDAERYQVRLRVKLTGDAYAPYASRPGLYPVVFQKNRHEHAQEGNGFLRLKQEGAYASPLNVSVAGITMYDVPLVRQANAVPAALPEDLSVLFAAKTVSVGGDKDRRLTVGTLLDAIEAATGTKVYADAVYRERPVLLSVAGNFAADSLLQALLFATGDVVRVLPPARPDEKPLYEIAHTAEPAGRVSGRIADWYQSVLNAERETQIDAYSRIAEHDPISLLRFDADDPMALTEALKARVVQAAREKKSRAGNDTEQRVSVPFGQLPAAAQKEIQAQSRRMVALGQQNAQLNPEVRTDNITIDCTPVFSYVVPGEKALAGEIDAEPLGGLEQWLPEIPADVEAATNRIVLLAPATLAEAQELVAAARRAKAKEIWVQAPPEIVAAAVPAAGDVPVRAVVSLLRVKKDILATLPRDENLYGKTSADWLVPDNPAVIQYAANLVRDAAAVPGIAGLVLRDAVPPGYQGGKAKGQGETTWSGESGAQSVGTAGALGYTLEHRRAFVQETGKDPADIVERTPVAFGWQEEKEPLQAWRVWVGQQVQPLWTAVRAAAGEQTLLVEGETRFGRAGRTVPEMVAIYAPWNAGEPAPPLAALFGNTRNLAPALSESASTLAVIAGSKRTSLPASELIRLLGREAKPETTLWDLSNRPVRGTAERLRALRRGSGTTP